MTTLNEFESYFASTYIVSCNLVQDLLSRLFSKARPHSYEDSIKNIASAINGLKILKNKKLEKNLTDIQIETILTQCLLLRKNLASEDTTLPILWVGGAYTTQIMPPKLS